MNDLDNSVGTAKNKGEKEAICEICSAKNMSTEFGGASALQAVVGRNPDFSRDELGDGDRLDEVVKADPREIAVLALHPGWVQTVPHACPKAMSRPTAFRDKDNVAMRSL